MDGEYTGRVERENCAKEFDITGNGLISKIKKKRQQE